MKDDSGRWNWYGESMETENNNIYNAKFWIYEEKRFGTWKESQEFYRKLDEKERLQATEEYIRQHLSSRPSSGTPAWGDLRRRLVED